MKLAIVSDSSAYLNPSLKEHPDLFIIPIPVIIDGQIYDEGVNISEEKFYTLLNSSKDFPTTSQPVLGEALQLFTALKEKGYDTVISLHLSGGISGFGQTLNTIKDDIEGLTIIPYDTMITSMPMGFMVEAALNGIDEGASLDAILQHLDVIRDHTHAFMIVDDLNNLVRGGRLTNGAAIIGGLLKIKPILTFTDGTITLHEKIRSQKKALQRTETIVGGLLAAMPQPYKLFVIHANNLPVATSEAAKLQKMFPEAVVEIGSFGPVIGTHLGEKAVALGVCPI